MRHRLARRSSLEELQPCGHPCLGRWCRRRRPRVRPLGGHGVVRDREFDAVSSAAAVRRDQDPHSLHGAKCSKMFVTFCVHSNLSVAFKSFKCVVLCVRVASDMCVVAVGSSNSLCILQLAFNTCDLEPWPPLISAQVWLAVGLFVKK